jgi:hypothetical protein
VYSIQFTSPASTAEAFSEQMEEVITKAFGDMAQLRGFVRRLPLDGFRRLLSMPSIGIDAWNDGAVLIRNLTHRVSS